jgi:hypothetical protein
VKDGRPAVIDLITCKVLKIKKGGVGGINFLVNRHSAVLFMVRNPANPTTLVHLSSSTDHCAPGEGNSPQSRFGGFQAGIAFGGSRGIHAHGESGWRIGLQARHPLAGTERSGAEARLLGA